MVVETPASDTKLSTRRKSVAASTIGNVLEWYEWSAYAVFAPFIAAVMFDPSNRISALLATLGVFAVGFLMRPLGGIVFGRIADRKGRKFVLIVTMLIMAGGSLAIAIMPTYSQIGVVASLLLLLVRIAQGFAHGGESATANSYLAEIAPPARRGLWGSATFVAIFGGSVLAYTVGGVITSAMSESQVGEWGWRIPFIFGALLALVALYMRRAMMESEVFENETTQSVNDSEPVPVDKKLFVRTAILVVLMTSGLTAAHYTWSSYVSTLAITDRGMDPQGAYWALVIAQCLGLIAIPFLGILSDRVGRRPIFISTAVLLIILQFPLTLMISNSVWTLIISSSVALLVVGMAGASLSAYLSELFPTNVRTQGIGLAYSISVAVFGGTAPYLNQLFNSLELPWLSSAYVIFLCVLTAIAVWLLPETKGADLNKTGRRTSV